LRLPATVFDYYGFLIVLFFVPESPASVIFFCLLFIFSFSGIIQEGTSLPISHRGSLVRSPRPTPYIGGFQQKRSLLTPFSLRPKLRQRLLKRASLYVSAIPRHPCVSSRVIKRWPRYATLSFFPLLLPLPSLNVKGTGKTRAGTSKSLHTCYQWLTRLLMVCPT